MTVREIIDDLINDLPSYAQTDQNIVCDCVLKAKRIVFLDTCFIVRLKYFELEQLRKLMDRILLNYDPSQIVFVITELILYESRDDRSNRIKDYFRDIISIAEAKSVRFLLLQEEALYKCIMPYSNYSVEEWNNLFIYRLSENKSNLIKITGLIKSDSHNPACSLFVESEKKLKNRDFIGKTIEQLKERKKSEDSLAEELICVLIFFLFEGFVNTQKKKIYFCSSDNKALAKLKKAISSSYCNCASNFENIHLFSLTQYMISQGILTDKASVNMILKNAMASKVLVTEKKELPFCESDQIMSLEQVIDGIFEGKQYSYKGNSP